MSVSTSRAVAYCPEEEITIDESRFQSRPSVVKENEFTKQKDNETRREMATMLYGFVQPGTSRRILFCGIAAPGGDKQDQTQLRSSFVVNTYNAASSLSFLLWHGNDGRRLHFYKTSAPFSGRNHQATPSFPLSSSLDTPHLIYSNIQGRPWYTLVDSV